MLVGECAVNYTLFVSNFDVASDHLTGTGQYPAASMVKGDLFMLAGATLYGFTNATEASGRCQVCLTDAHRDF
jgi:hypothetical protein